MSAGTATGNFFRTQRERLGLSQFQLAVSLGVTPSAVSGWERGQAPALKLVKSIAAQFGCSEQRVMQEMLALTEDKKAKAVSV